jgi:hypothetical protein
LSYFQRFSSYALELLTATAGLERRAPRNSSVFGLSVGAAPLKARCASANRAATFWKGVRNRLYKTVNNTYVAIRQSHGTSPQD